MNAVISSLFFVAIIVVLLVFLKGVVLFVDAENDVISGAILSFFKGIAVISADTIARYKTSVNMSA